MVVSGSTLADNFVSGAGNSFGTEGLFSAISTRGNLASGIDPLLAPATNLGEFDSILNEFDNQGAIEENMMFLDRNTALAVDDMLAAMNSYGAGGTSFGVLTTQKTWHLT